MEMTLSLVGPGGDARLSFTDHHIRLTWAETSSRERKMIAKLIKACRAKKFTVATVDADGKPELPARWRDLPGMFGKGNGEVLLQGLKKDIVEIAKTLVEAEVDGGAILMKAQDDGTWKVITETPEEAKPVDDKKVEVKATKPVGGG